MMLPVEKWIGERKFNDSVNILFKESVLAYKAGAYMAALLFSYTAFLTKLKYSILVSDKPTLVDDGRWNALQRKLRNENKWEEELLNELFNNSNPIFILNDNLREQIRYWKGRRNDCAHSKDNEISYYHVEAFWSFLYSNLSKINLRESKEELILKFKKHFDYSYTPPGTDFTYLIREIDITISKEQIPDFLKELVSAIDGFIFFSEETYSVVNKILEICSGSTIEQLIIFIKQEKETLAFLGRYPEKILLFNLDPAEVRRMWMVDIFKNGYRKETFEVFGALLRNKMIPAIEIEEALELFYKKYDQRKHDSVYMSDAVHLSLQSNGFGDIIFKHINDEGLKMKYYDVNSKAELFAYYFKNYPLTMEAVKFVCSHSSRGYDPEWLERELVELFNSNKMKKAEFTRLATENLITIPTIYG